MIKDLKIKDKNKILFIGNEEMFDAFEKEYGFENKKVKKMFEKTLFKPISINWKKVSKDYGGIEICPYLWEKRNTVWYYSWDVASGCIWNLEPILKEIQLVGRIKN